MNPNVLLVVLDTVRAESCSLHGRERPTTPGLEQLRSESVFFERAIAPASWTVPSHASMFTGKYPSDIGVHAKNKVLPEHEQTIAGRLRDQGYSTAMISSNPFLTEGSRLYRGFDYRYTSGMKRTLFEDAFDPAEYIKTREHEQGVAKILELASNLRGPPGNILKNVLNAIYYKYRTTWKSDDEDKYDPGRDDGAMETIAQFQQWTEESSKPFFACLNFMEVHKPFRHRTEYLPAWANIEDVRKLSQDRHAYYQGEAPLTDRERELLRALYEAELRYLDEQLQGLWRFLRNNDSWDDTLIIITSDHGEYLGEDDLVFHAVNRLGEPLVHVPLLVKYPDGMHGGTTVEATVSLTQVFDTIVSATDDINSDVEPLAPGTKPELVKCEYICMDPDQSTEGFVEPYRDLDVPSRAVYDDGTKYLLLNDGRAYRFDDVSTERGIRNEGSIHVEDVPHRIVEFANLDERIENGSDIAVSESVERRLEELGYR